MKDKILYSPETIKEIIQDYRFNFSKSLGQNFLIDGNIISKIIEKSDINPKDFILEIGPGIGTLTKELSSKAGKVVAVELDKNLIPILNDTLSGCKNVEIVHGDILKVDLNKIFSEMLKDGNVKVIGNLPYYITTPIIMKLLEKKLKIDKIIVMVQKEVAVRMQASPGNKDYGALSVAVQYYSNPQIIVNVPRHVFMPRPNVDSAVVMLDVYKKPIVDVINEERFFQVVKSAFGQRRKTLLNALAGGNLGLSKEKIKDILIDCDIDPQKRGETLKLEDFAKISNAIFIE